MTLTESVQVKADSATPDFVTTGSVSTDHAAGICAPALWAPNGVAAIPTTTIESPVKNSEAVDFELEPGIGK